MRNKGLPVLIQYLLISLNQDRRCQVISENKLQNKPMTHQAWKRGVQHRFPYGMIELETRLHQILQYDLTKRIPKSYCPFLMVNKK